MPWTPCHKRLIHDLAKIWLVTIIGIFGAGCASMKEALTNRVVCTIPHDHAFVASMWGFFGIVTPLHKDDGAVICPPSPNSGEKK